jgi:hypothetical protein
VRSRSYSAGAFGCARPSTNRSIVITGRTIALPLLGAFDKIENRGILLLL